jgi:hypothetical protein
VWFDALKFLNWQPRERSSMTTPGKRIRGKEGLTGKCCPTEKFRCWCWNEETLKRSPSYAACDPAAIYWYWFCCITAFCHTNNSQVPLNFHICEQCCCGTSDRIPENEWN